MWFINNPKSANQYNSVLQYKGNKPLQDVLFQEVNNVVAVTHRHTIDYLHTVLL